MIWIKIKAKHPNVEMFPNSNKRNNESLNRSSGKGEGGTEELRRYLRNGPHEMHKKNLGWLPAFPFGWSKNGAAFHGRRNPRSRCWAVFSEGRWEEQTWWHWFHVFSLWCLQGFGRTCLKDLRVGSWQFETQETLSQCPEQEWLCSAWFANITGNTGRRVFRKYLWAGINSRGCSSKGKVHPFLTHLPNQSVRAPVPTKMEGEVMECRRKKQRGRRLFWDNRSQLQNKIILPPSLKSAQAHQLNNAYHLVSQLESFS